MKVKYEEVEEEVVDLRKNGLKKLGRLYYFGLLSGIGLGLVFNDFVFAGLTVLIGSVVLYTK